MIGFSTIGNQFCKPLDFSEAKRQPGQAGMHSDSGLTYDIIVDLENGDFFAIETGLSREEAEKTKAMAMQLFQEIGVVEQQQQRM